MSAPTLGPLYRTAPAWEHTNGDIVNRVAVDMGFPNLDPDQRWSLDAIAAEDADGLPVCGEYCVVGPRQTTGKSAALIVAAIADVFVFDQQLHVWTAHEFKTARKSYLDMKRRIKAHPDYASRVTFRDSHGEEAVLVDDGERAIEFHARSGSSGRGFTTGRITMDEAMYVQPGDLGALVPTLITIEDAQIRYAASAGMLQSGALRGLRKKGRAGDADDLAYIEHGAPVVPCEDGDGCLHDLKDPGCALNNEDLWLQANPGLRSGRVPMKSMRKQRSKLAAAPLEFAREFLTWWEDPAAGSDSAINSERWEDLRITAPTRRGAIGYGVATAPDRSWTAIGAAWRQDDGRVCVTLTSYKDDNGKARPDYRRGQVWVPERIRRLRQLLPGKVAADTASRNMLPEADHPSEEQQAQAEASFSDAVNAGTVVHLGEAALNVSVSESRWKQGRSMRRLVRDGHVDTSPLAAVVLALHVLGKKADPLSQIQ